jgi:hypothetical protein
MLPLDPVLYPVIVRIKTELKVAQSMNSVFLGRTEGFGCRASVGMKDPWMQLAGRLRESAAPVPRTWEVPRMASSNRRFALRNQFTAEKTPHAKLHQWLRKSGSSTDGLGGDARADRLRGVCTAYMHAVLSAGVVGPVSGVSWAKHRSWALSCTTLLVGGEWLS